MSATYIGPRMRTMERDRTEGHRDYTVVHLVSTSSVNDGPTVVMGCSGLPAIGDYWNFGNDSDPWAICTPYLKISFAPGVREETGHGVFWHVEQVFTTRPVNRCQTDPINDPLLEPMKISGSFVRYTKERQFNNDGTLIKTSSHELIKGQAVEYDSNRPTVHIEQNVASLDLDVMASLVNGVNDSPLWGVPERCVQLSGASWERKYYGVCSVYYTRIFDFDIDFNTFDRVALDEGTKVLRGEWKDNPLSPGTAPDEWVLTNIAGSPPDPTNPSHFVRYKDRHGENTRVVLDGAGKPANSSIVSGTGTSTSGNAGGIAVYPLISVNMTLLSIPTSL